MSGPNYDKYPCVVVTGHDHQCWRGWGAVCDEIRRAAERPLSACGRAVVAVECYTGLHEAEIAGELKRGLQPNHFLSSRDAFKDADEIDRLAAPYLGGDDPIFGYYTPLSMEAFLDPVRRRNLCNRQNAMQGLVLVYGTGAMLCCNPDLVVYADMPRWECQLRQRQGQVSNLGVDNSGLKPSLQYKRGFFVDWRVCDRLKQATISQWDYLLDTTAPGDPKLVTGQALRTALEQCVRRPFRVVPFFDPAPWGGQWMKQQLGLEPPAYDAPNYGWCFDCVPEENSLLLRFGKITVEVPSINLVLYRPRHLLGDGVYARFGAEFPIRFDLLDTMGGGNLSFQVHPTEAYAREKFGLRYTQDESYYVMDAGENASVFLGLKSGVDPTDMLAALDRTQSGREPFATERYAARWPARKHDHFLIPAGTVHCSGANTMVLEISATPYIFTFKLWDWGRPGLDGLPRPINLDHGRQVIQWNHDENWTRANLINRVQPLRQEPGWREERTGLHRLQCIETHRHWFTSTVPHDTGGGVNVLNLVEGREAVVESPDNAFDPFFVHYAETFIVPAHVGRYTIRPVGTSPTGPSATIKAVSSWSNKS
jgi:hypothetical protein